jgi:serine protease Do
VADVEPKSAADQAGVARGDLIVRVDAHDVASPEEFEQRVDDHREGERITLTLRREDRDAEVALRATSFPTEQADALGWRLLGVEVGEDRDGLVVRRVRPDGPAARIGVQRGDRLLGLGGAALAKLGDYRKKIIELRSARSTLLSVGRGRYQYNVNVGLARR